MTRKQALKQLGGLTSGAGLFPQFNFGRKCTKKGQEQNNLKAIPHKTTKLPRIIFLMTDQFRTDALKCAGNEAVITPILDKIAQTRVLFKNAYSSVPSCTPVRACLLTGMNPPNNVMLGFRRIARKYKYEMARMIRNAGYYTYCIGKNNWLPEKALHGFNGTLVDFEDTNFRDGYVSDYHDWFKFHAPGEDPNKTGLDWNGYQAKNYALKENLHPTYWTGKSAVDFIKNYNLDAPLFLKVSWVRPHSPYDPPQDYLDLYKNVKIPCPVIGGPGTWDEKFVHYHSKRSDTCLSNFGTHQAIKSNRYYYANIIFVDKWTGQIINTLKEKGMYENAIITFCSDHGDMLGHHHHWRKPILIKGELPSCLYLDGP